jgi:hypothetical protein
MRRIRPFIGALACLALIFGGYGRVAAAADPTDPCHSPAHAITAMQLPDHGFAADHHGAGDHAYHGGHAAHLDRGAAGDDSNGDHECFKCCGVCTTAAAYAVERNSPDTVLTASPVLYRVGAQDFTGRRIIIDPGIPKRMG